MTEAETKFFKMHPLFKLFADFLEVLSNPDKYGTLIEGLREESGRMETLVSKVGPAAEITAMHAQATEARDEAKGLLTESKSVTSRVMGEAEEAKVIIITKAREEANAERTGTEERLEAQRVATQDGTNRLAERTTEARRVHDTREARVKGREDKVRAAEKTVCEAAAKLEKDEADLQRRLDSLDAAMRPAKKG